MKQAKCEMLVCILCALIAAGCSSPAPQAGTQPKAMTLVDQRLGTDVLDMIGEHEHAAGRNRKPTLISAEFVGRDGSAFMERWIVSSGGQKVTYSVKLTPMPTGGVHYVAKRIEP